MAQHLGLAKNQMVANAAGNPRNGRRKKTRTGDLGKLPLDIPHDRHASFEPQMIPKHQTPLAWL